jgi:cyclophilin family peptidyl-prolyl cis-trans isomerase
MTDDRRRTSGDGPIPTFDLYATLGVRPGATQEEVREAAAAMDRRVQAAAARQRGGSTARQKRLNIARHWLLNPDRRRRYDTEVARRAAGASTGRVRGTVGAGSATRSGPASWLTRPLTWVGIAIVAVVAGLLVFRPFASDQTSSVSGSVVLPSAAASGSAGVAGPVASTDRSGCPTSQPPAGQAGKQELVTISTDLGDMQVTVDNDLSPIAAGNFVALASCGFYNGVVFHRVATLQDGTPFVIQGGDPTGTGSGGPGYAIQDEPVITAYKRGTVAMARTASPNSAGSQFFIVLDDKDAAVLSSANTYQIFGSVTSGMETADKIYAAAGGQEEPANPVVMNTVTVGTPSASSTPAASAAASPAASTVTSSSP